MITKIIGRVLFSRLPVWQQHRRARTALYVGFVTVGLASAVGVLMYWANSRH
jgi:hypothetical protein